MSRKWGFALDWVLGTSWWEEGQWRKAKAILGAETAGAWVTWERGLVIVVVCAGTWFCLWLERIRVWPCISLSRGCYQQFLKEPWFLYRKWDLESKSWGWVALHIAAGLSLLPGPFRGQSQGTCVYTNDCTVSLGTQSSFLIPYFVFLLLIVRTLVPYIGVNISPYFVCPTTWTKFQNHSSVTSSSRLVQLYN